MRSVTLLALVVLSFAGFNALGAAQGWMQLRYLRQLPLSLPPEYLIGRDALWALVLAGVSVGLWRRWRWGRVSALIAFPLYFAHGWVERLAFGRSDFSRTPLVWAALWTAFWIALAWGVLWRTRAASDRRR